MKHLKKPKVHEHLCGSMRCSEKKRVEQLSKNATNSRVVSFLKTLSPFFQSLRSVHLHEVVSHAWSGKLSDVFLS